MSPNGVKSESIGTAQGEAHGKRFLNALLAFLLAASLASLPSASADEGAPAAKNEKKAASGFTDAVARRLLAEAASVDAHAAQSVLKLGYKQPPANNARLTLVAAMWHDVAPKGLARDYDLRFHMTDPRKELIAHLLLNRAHESGSIKRVSLLRADSIKRLVYQQKGARVSGRAHFEHPKTCDGNVAFRAELVDGAWVMRSLAFPETKIGVELRGGNWTLVGPRATSATESGVSAKSEKSEKDDKVRVKLPEGDVDEAKGSDDNVRPKSQPIDTKIDERIAKIYENALRWLAAHQSSDGGWSATQFHKVCDGHDLQVDRRAKNPGIGKAHYDVGVTGLALHAFLSAGITNRGKHPHARVVSKGLRYLKRIQDKEGCFGKRKTQQYSYNHVMASLPMVQAYGLTGSAVFKSSAQRSLDFIALCRNPYFGWRYGVRTGENDTSLTCANYLVIDAANRINKRALARSVRPPLVVDESAQSGVLSWLQKVTDADTGRVGYIARGTPPARPPEFQDRFPASKSESMTAAALLVQLRMGKKPTDKHIANGLQLLKSLRPQWDVKNGNIDLYYWYYGTAALHEVGGEDWHDWRRAISEAMQKAVTKDGDICGLKGSLDPAGPWGPDGGRVYSTAMLGRICGVLLSPVEASADGSSAGEAAKAKAASGAPAVK